MWSVAQLNWQAMRMCDLNAQCDVRLFWENGVVVSAVCRSEDGVVEVLECLSVALLYDVDGYFVCVKKEFDVSDASWTFWVVLCASVVLYDAFENDGVLSFVSAFEIG